MNGEGGDISVSYSQEYLDYLHYDLTGTPRPPPPPVYPLRSLGWWEQIANSSAWDAELGTGYTAEYQQYARLVVDRMRQDGKTNPFDSSEYLPGNWADGPHANSFLNKAGRVGFDGVIVAVGVVMTGGAISAMGVGSGVAAGTVATETGVGSGIAAGAVAAETSVAVVEGAELAALVEAGTVGAEGAFLEAAALSGSSVTYATGTGAILSAVTPAGETVLFDAAIDPYTQFSMDMSPIETVQTPDELPNTPSQQSPQQAPKSSSIPKPVTDYATKLLASEAVKMLTGAPQSPGANASAATNRGVAPGSETGDITPLVAFAMIAGAFMLR